jgi:cell division protein FtsB
MNAKTKLSKPLSRIFATGLSCAFFVYLAFHLAHGDRGYFALKGIEDKRAAAEARYEKVLAEREALEANVRMLRPASLDADLLEERARIVLGFVEADEVVVMAGRM